MPSRPVNLASSIHHCIMRGMEAVAIDLGHAFPYHTYGQFSIGIVDRGTQKPFSGRGTVEADAGDVITVNPLEVHDDTPVDDAGCTWRMPYLDLGVVADMATDLHLGHHGDAEFDRPVTRDAALASHVYLLFAQMTMPGVRNDVLLRKQLLLSALADMLYPTNRPTSHHTDTVLDVIRFTHTRIDDDPAVTISLLDPARGAGPNRFQVLRGFARVTDFAPHAYQARHHVALVRRLIARGEPLAEVAATCGFADQNHMTRQFVRKYDASPGMMAAAR